MENEEELLSLSSTVEELLNIRKFNDLISLLIIYGKNHLINSIDATNTTKFNINFWFVYKNTHNESFIGSVFLLSLCLTKTFSVGFGRRNFHHSFLSSLSSYFKY